MTAPRKPFVWLHGEIKTPPFSQPGRIEAGWLLGRLQAGELLSTPHSRPMPSVGPRCHELRVRDEGSNWRIVYRLDAAAILILSVFAKTTRATPPREITTCQRRLGRYDQAANQPEGDVT